MQSRHVAAPWDPTGAGRVEADGWGRVSVAWELRAPCRPIFFIGRRWLHEEEEEGRWLPRRTDKVATLTGMKPYAHTHTVVRRCSSCHAFRVSWLFARFFLFLITYLGRFGAVELECTACSRYILVSSLFIYLCNSLTCANTEMTWSHF